MSIIEEESSNDELKQCRICLDNDHPNELISPCLCNGSSAYVHRKCLNNWRSENANGKGFKYCDICHFEYVIETIISDQKEERKRLFKYYLFVIRDLILINLIIQLIVICLAFLLKLIDRNWNNVKDIFPNSMNGFILYYLSAFILLLALLGLLAFIICCYAIGIDLNTNTNYSNRNGNSASRWFNGIGIIVLIFAFIGIFVGIILSFIIFKKIIKYHTQKLWLRQEADKYIVKDFHGKRNQIKTNLPIQSLIV
jgi:hypothetical protein